MQKVYHFCHPGPATTLDMKLTHWYWQNYIFFTNAGGDDDMMVIDYDHDYPNFQNLLVLLVLCDGSEEVREVRLTFAVRYWALRAGEGHG